MPDLRMECGETDGRWTPVSPGEVPDLHDRVGPAFRAAYETNEARAARSETRVTRHLRAVDPWRRMPTMLFETGHRWIASEDP